MLQYRKVKATGDWAVMGPVAEVKCGLVKVTKKSGEVSEETVVSLGKPFMIEGVPHVYGYTQTKEESQNNRDASRQRYPWTGCSCGSQEGNPRDSDCRDCQHDW